MNDCLWFAIKICDRCCDCNKYLSMNCDKGHELKKKWAVKVSNATDCSAVEFAKENGFFFYKVDTK